MESSRPPSVAKKLWHIFRVVYYMIRKGISKRKLMMMDLDILLKRGKIAGKALSNLITTFHHHGHHHHGMRSSSSSSSTGGLSCRSMDPNLSFYNPTREVEFSCSNTPSYPSFLLSSNKRKNHRSSRSNSSSSSSSEYDAVAAIAKAFEALNNISSSSEIVSDGEYSVGPSPMVGFGVMSTPRMVRQLRITDSPFPIMEDEVAADHGKVDKEAEEFIKWFYEQLRIQQSVAVATPEYKPRRG